VRAAHGRWDLVPHVEDLSRARQAAKVAAKVPLEIIRPVLASHLHHLIGRRHVPTTWMIRVQGLAITTLIVNHTVAILNVGVGSLQNVFVQTGLPILSAGRCVNLLLAQPELEVALVVGTHANHELHDISSRVRSLRLGGVLHVRLLLHCGSSGRLPLEGISTQTVRVDRQHRGIHSSSPTRDIVWTSTLATVRTILAVIVLVPHDVPRPRLIKISVRVAANNRGGED
jgi:hypothetical protein